jgi:hypothetical protein
MMRAFRSALWETRWRVALPFTLLALLLIGDWARQAFDDYVKRNGAIYQIVEGSEWFVRTGPVSIIYSAEAVKLQDCFVEVGQTATVGVFWHDPSGNHRVRSYELLRPGGASVSTGPIVRKGDHFMVGPFIFTGDDPNLFKLPATLTQSLRCRFETGQERVATIGPIEIPAARP